MFWSTHKIVISTGHELHHPHYAHFYCYFSHRLGIKRVKAVQAAVCLAFIANLGAIVTTALFVFVSSLPEQLLKSSSMALLVIAGNLSNN